MDITNLTETERASVEQFRKELAFYSPAHICNFLRVYAESARRHREAVEASDGDGVYSASLDASQTALLSREDLIELTVRTFATGLVWYRRALELAENKHRLDQVLALASVQ
jgi:hypothetical protein